MNLIHVPCALWAKAHKIITITAATTLLAGCVSVADPGNYRPQTASLSQDYYACDSASTGTGASIRWNQYGGSGNVGPRINSDMLLRCMEAHNYRLRRATTGEWVAGIAFLPLTIPLAVMSAGQYPGSDIRYGGGSADPEVNGYEAAGVPRSNSVEEGERTAAAPPVDATTTQGVAAPPPVAASTPQRAAAVLPVAAVTAQSVAATPPIAASRPAVNPNAVTNQRVPFENWEPAQQ
jgi:hypothetical protein